MGKASGPALQTDASSLSDRVRKIIVLNVNLLDVSKTKTAIDRLTDVLCQPNISFMSTDQ